jgi:hypothetical protein
MHPIIHYPPPYVPPPVAPPAQPAPFPPGHLIYDPAALFGQLLAVAGNALTTLILLCVWVGLAAGLGLVLAALLHRYAGPGMTGRDAALTAAVLLAAGYVINGIPFWQGWPSVVTLVTTIVLAAMHLSPASHAPGRIQAFWVRRLVLSGGQPR